MDILDKINQETARLQKIGGRLTNLLVGKNEIQELRNLTNSENGELETPLILRGLAKLSSVTIHELTKLDSYFEGFDLEISDEKTDERFEKILQENSEKSI